MKNLSERLSDGEILILDGGIGAELEDRGVPMDEQAWSGTAVLEHYDVVRAMHEDYVAAGADVITTNTFGTSHQALTAAGLGDRVAEINRLSVQAAREARERVAHPVLIAAALFPGYRDADKETRLPDPPPDAATLRRWLDVQTEAMAAAGADVFALEMVPTTFWGRIAVESAAATGLPVWLGVSYVPPAAARQRESVGRLLEEILTPDLADAIQLVTVMHTEIDDVDTALDEVAGHWDGALGVYPHRGRWWNEQAVPHFQTLPVPSPTLVDASRRWIDRGVQVLGGCCGVTPENIRALKAELPGHLPAGARARGGRERGMT